MAAITHPNLALIYGAEAWQGTPILVIEYLAGRTLSDRIERGPLLPLEALELCAVLAGALEHLHDSGFLHRDVKPSNIGFTERGAPKLLDFGLVRIAGRHYSSDSVQVTSEGRLTDSGLVGTPLYMSPEALAGERPNPSFDVWSLAVVAFEAIAGRHPFERAGAGETLAAIQAGNAVDLSRVRPDCPPEVVALFAHLLAPDHSQRPSSAKNLAQLLRDTRAAIAPAGRTSRPH
jgi:serine/threonine-protein kinase